MITLDAVLHTVILLAIWVAGITVVSGILYFAVAMIMYIHERWLEK